MNRTRQVLIFDADDTLWENNVHFLRVIDTFFDWAGGPAADRSRMHATLDAIETLNTARYGYSLRVFVRSLGECFERIRGRPATVQERRRIDRLTADLARTPVQPVQGAADTLAALATRHDLLLLTQGDAQEQQAKIDASGLARHFRAVRIVPRKHVDVYRDLVAELALSPDASWMIGNSPKSDIVPARQAGLRAVFVPNPHTWTLENETFDFGDPGVLRVAAFPELLEHF